MNSKISITQRVTFCAGHRIYQHESKCAHLHGHNYTAFFTVNAPELDEKGRVIDFGQLKHLLGGWIEENWDHGFICSRDDKEAQQALAEIKGQKMFLLDANPTVENMAHYLLHVVGPSVLRETNVTLSRTILWETENCFADVSLANRTI